MISILDKSLPQGLAAKLPEYLLALAALMEKHGINLIEQQGLSAAHLIKLMEENGQPDVVVAEDWVPSYSANNVEVTADATADDYVKLLEQPGKTRWGVDANTEYPGLPEMLTSATLAGWLSLLHALKSGDTD